MVRWFGGFYGLIILYFRDLKTQKELLLEFQNKMQRLSDKKLPKKNLYQLAWWELSRIPGNGTCDCELCSMGLWCS